MWKKFKHRHWHEKFVIKSLLSGDRQMQDKWPFIMLSFYYLTTVIWELCRAPQLEKERCIFIITVMCYSGAVLTKVHVLYLCCARIDKLLWFLAKFWQNLGNIEEHQYLIFSLVKPIKTYVRRLGMIVFLNVLSDDFDTMELWYMDFFSSQMIPHQFFELPRHQNILSFALKGVAANI